jgi:hypothetical protein
MIPAIQGIKRIDADIRIKVAPPFRQREHRIQSPRQEKRFQSLLLFLFHNLDGLAYQIRQ